MAAVTVKMGKRGTLVVPAKLRRQFGMDDGTVVNIDADANGIFVRPAVAYDVEVYTPERRAELLLGNAMTKEEWDLIVAGVRADGLDPLKIPFVELNQRELLPTRAEWEEQIRRSQMTERDKRIA